MKKSGFIWKFYALYWTVITFHASVDVFSPGSPAYAFYHILGAFHQSFMVIYIIDSASTIFNIFSLIPLYGFAFHKQLLTADFWKPLFVLRVAFDVCGSYYEFVSVKSLFASDPWLGFQVLIGILLTMIPSYAACYQYAFAWNRIFPAKK